MKKVLLSIIIVTMLVVQFLPCSVFADAADMKAVLAQLNGLDDTKRAALIGKVYDAIINELTNNYNSPSADTVYTALDVAHDAALQSVIGPGPGKILESSVKTIIQKLLNNKQVIKNYNDIYMNSFGSKIKTFLGLNANDSIGKVYTALYPYRIPILTSKNNATFEKYGDVLQKAALKLGVEESWIATAAGNININDKVGTLADRINSAMTGNGLTFTDVKDCLDVFGIYSQPDTSMPSVSSTDPTNTETGVAIDKTISVTFNENILKWSSYNGIALKNKSTGNNVSITISIVNAKLTMVASNSLSYSTTYAVTIPANSIQDFGGNLLAAQYTFEFTTRSSGGGGGDGGGGGGGGGGGVPGSGTGDTGSSGQVQNDLNSINSIINSNTSGTLDAGAITQIESKLDNIVNTIENISNPTTALTQAENVIANLGTVLTNAATSGVSTGNIVAAVEELAQAVMDKVESTNIITAVTGSNATISLGTDTVNQLIGKLDTIVQTANTLNGKLAAAGTGISVEAVLKIKADAGANVNDVIAKLPAELIAAAEQKKIDKIAVETGLATLSIAPDAIPVTAGSALSLETRIPTAAEVNNAVSELAAKANMTPEQVQNLQNELKGATVYDFNAIVGTSKFTGNFSKPVDVAVPYTLKAGDNPDNITVYYINDSGVLENVSGAYDPVTKTVKFSTWHFSKYVIKLNNVTFKDVTTSNWAKKYIEAMAAKGVITGTGDGNFESDGNLTRAQFAAMIVRLFKLSDAGASVSFSDVKPGQWFYKEVAAAVKAGIITGRGDGTFAPNENITRQDMVVIIARAVTKFKNGTIPADTSKILVKYGDKDKIADYAKGAIALSSMLGITDGMPGGIFMPQGLSTRAQAAKIIYSVFNLK